MLSCVAPVALHADAATARQRRARAFDAHDLPATREEHHEVKGDEGDSTAADRPITILIESPIRERRNIPDPLMWQGRAAVGFSR